MATMCPKCGEPVDHLRNYSSATIVYDVSLDGDYLQYDQDDVISGEDGDYDCPSCGIELAYNEEEALAFMKGEGISQKMAEYYTELAMQGKDK